MIQIKMPINPKKPKNNKIKESKMKHRKKQWCGIILLGKYNQNNKSMKKINKKNHLLERS